MAAPFEATPAPAASPPQARGSLRWWLAAVGLVALAGVAVSFMHFRETPPEARVVRFSIAPTDDLSNSGSFAFRYAASPDGQRFLVDTFGEANENTAPITVVLNWLAAVKR